MVNNDFINFGKNKKIAQMSLDLNAKKKLWSEILQHTIIIVVFFILTVAYFSPAFEGKVLQQMDLTHAQALSHQTIQIYKKTGHFCLWNSSIFGGMPNYTITLPPKHNIFKIFIHGLAFLPYTTARIFFLYLIGFYLLLLTVRVNKWLSAIFSIAFALSTYNIIIIAVGHITKAYAIAFMPLVLASFILIFERKSYLWGTIALAVSLGAQIYTTHIQIIYYTGLLAAIYVTYYFILALLKKEKFKSFLIGLSLSVLGTVLAILPNTLTLWLDYEWSKFSIRGSVSELAIESGQTKKVKGLDKDYALSWSYGIGESLSLFIPEIKGGASDYLGNDVKLMAKVNSPYKQYLAQQMRYFGPQPFTAGPVYFGAIVVFLFILGFFIVKGADKWWILAATLLSIMLAWGKHFEPLTDLFYNYVPLYNKFRAVSMILVIAELLVPMFAAITVNEIVKNPELIKLKRNGFIISLALTAGVALIIALVPRIAGPLLSSQETNFLKQLSSTQPVQVVQQYRQFFNDLEDVRAMIVRSSAWRSFIFIILGAAVVWLYSIIKERKPYWLYTVLGLLIIVDLWAIDRKYLNDKNYKPKRIAKAKFNPTKADEFILKTKEKDFRVLNLTVDPFNDAMTAYYHQSIGGYSAVKMRRYQDIIEKYLFPYTQTLVAALKDTTGTVNILQVLKPMQVLHMLNTLYIIVNPNMPPILNPYAFGNAWFVNGYKFVNSATQEINALSQVDLRQFAVINRTKVKGVEFPELNMMPDTSRYIKLTYYIPDSLVYESFSHNTEFAVFSEIYYPKGWTATIDGKPAKIVLTDYILRGMIIPPGKHKIVMVFKPKSFYIGLKIDTIGSILIVLIVLGAIAYEIIKGRKNKIEKNFDNKAENSNTNNKSKHK